jgi:hypothetical protein
MEAKEAKENSITPGAARAAFVSLANVPVKLTYRFDGMPAVIEFKCKMALDQDDKEARQAFYAKPDGDQAAGLHRYYVDFLSRIVTSRPNGLPGFDELLPADAGAVKKSDIANAIKAYFETGEPILKKIAEDAVEMYNRISAPAEFFR